MTNHFLTFLFLLLSFNIYGQGENNNWYITDYLIDFNNTPQLKGVPYNRLIGPTSPSTVSDKDGNLLFISSGEELFNKNSEVTPNGYHLRASSSSFRQSAVFVPFPNDSNLFYLFTTGPAVNHSSELREMDLNYNIIDKRLDQGLGAIVNGKKNIFIRDNITGMMAVAKGECDKVWLIVHEFNTNRFIAYKISAEGISEPVISEVGTVFPESRDNPFRRANLRISPNGKKLVMFSDNLGITELFDFDNELGVVSAPIRLSIEPQTNTAFTGAFSPDNNKLYTIETTLNAGTRFYQFDLNKSTPREILDSKTLIRILPIFGIDMQLAPNGMILTGGWNSFISAISSPNEVGVACGFIDTFLVSNTTFRTPFQNLVVVPSTIQTDSLLLSRDTQLCQGNTLEINLAAEGDTYLWQDSTTTPNCEITTPGTYWVSIQKGNCTFRDTITIFPDASLAKLGNDTTLCEKEAVVLEVDNQTDLPYRWQDGSTVPNFTVTAAGTYWVEVTDSLCSSRDSIIVQQTLFDQHLPNDTTLCAADSLSLSLTEAGTTIRWQDGSTVPNFTVTAAGTYWVEVTDSLCSSRDSIIVQQTLFDQHLPNDTTLCTAERLNLSLMEAGATVSWQDGTTAPNFLVTDSGTYWARIEKAGCQKTDSITVSFVSSNTDFLPNDTTLCNAATFLISSEATSGSISWQDGSMGTTFLAETSGVYRASLQESNCLGQDSIRVDFQTVDMKLPNDTVVCFEEELFLDIDSQGGQIRWQDGTTDPIYMVTEAGKYWASLNVENCRVSDTIQVQFEDFELDLGVDTTLCEGETLTLSPIIAGDEYLWQDGSNQTDLTLSEAGQYWLALTKNGCVKKDSIFIEQIVCEEEAVCNVFLPNIFSPNGDGVNDDFQLLSNCELVVFSLKIYDRWGGLVFATKNIKNTWDGTYNGEKVKRGVYLVKSEYQFSTQDQPTILVKTLAITNP